MAGKKNDDEPTYVHPTDGSEHGYIGAAPTTGEELSIQSVVGDTANVADTPKSEQSKSTTTRKTAGS